MAWLKRGLLASQATFKFLVSGGQWESRGRSDSWASFIRERNELFQFIRDRRIGGVVLLSGDRHVTAGYQVQGRFIEITSSPFAEENHEPPYNPAEMFMLPGSSAWPNEALGQSCLKVRSDRALPGSVPSLLLPANSVEPV